MSGSDVPADWPMLWMPVLTDAEASPPEQPDAFMRRRRCGYGEDVRARPGVPELDVALLVALSHGSRTVSVRRGPLVA